MTNEQLTQRVINLETRQARCEGQHEKYELLFKELQEDVKTTKNLAEDVHIMAINMQEMQNNLSETNKKLDKLAKKDYEEYEENKKAIKGKLRDIAIGAIGTAIIGAISWLFMQYIR